MIRAILFEDVKKYQVQLQKLFDGNGNVYLTACFSNGKDAAKQVKKHTPDIVLMDIEMPFVSGLEALEDIKKAVPDAKVLLLTAMDDDEKVFQALCFGASGYVLKSDVANIEKAVQDVVSGGGYFTPEIGAKVIRLFRSHIPRSENGYTELSDQQTTVLKHLVDGKTSNDISEIMGIAFHTVRGHIKEIYRKLHVNSGPAAVREAIKRGIV